MTSVLYEDEWLLAVDKPAGALVVRGRMGEREESLVDSLSRERKEKLFIVHRLDRGTSGVLVFARSAAAHRTLNEAFEGGAVKKRYLAIVRGQPPRDAFEVSVALVPARRGKSRPALAGEEGKPSATAFRVLERLGGFALVQAEPRSGRLHQIRVHLKYAGFPLAVDPLYAKTEELTGRELGVDAERPILMRTPLHAQRIELAHPKTGATLVVEAPLPRDLDAALGALRAATSRP